MNNLQNQVLSWGKNDKAITIDRTAPAINTRIKYSDAWNKGYNIGQGIEEKFSAADASNTDLDALNNNVAAIAANTADTADALKLSSEDIRMLRNIADVRKSTSTRPLRSRWKWSTTTTSRTRWIWTA